MTGGRRKGATITRSGAGAGDVSEGFDTLPAVGEWQVRGRTIPLDRPLVVGVVNVTPDSFSDGGLYLSAQSALAHAGRLLEEGADILDVGGESTRPQGAAPVLVRDELRRVLPVIGAIAEHYPSAVISVDTTKSKVAAAALDAGAHIINDVSGMRLDARMATVCAESGAGAIIMHSRGGVQEMATYKFASYGSDPVGEVIAELIDSAEKVLEQGVSQRSLVLDPGIGFSKHSALSVAMLRELRRVVSLGYPVMVGVSRKRFIGELSGVTAAADRVYGSVAANVIALMNGATLFRVHDVLAARQALAVAWGIISQEDG